MKRSTAIFFRVLLLIYIAAVMYLCFGNFQNVQGVKWSYFGIPTDKIVHFAMFFPFPLLVNWAIGRRPKSALASVIISLLLGLAGLLMAAGTEIGQSALTTWRMGDVADFRADCLAIGISSVLTLIINLFRCRKER